MDSITVTPEEFVDSAKKFCEISTRLRDGWDFYENKDDIQKSFIRKNTFIPHERDGEKTLYKAEFVIFYNLSYGVPSFSFNIWNSSGVLLTLNDIREMSLIRLDEEDFYSIITQQEHPIFFRPYFMMHPCETANLLAAFKKKSKNVIITFLSLTSPLLRTNLSLDYGF